MGDGSSYLDVSFPRFLFRVAFQLIKDRMPVQQFFCGFFCGL